jgi:FkbM family methyltransferase
MRNIFSRVKGRLQVVFERELGVVPKKYIGKFLPPQPVIVEAGAYTGNDTVKMAKRWPGATIHAFEPVPAVYDKLRRAAAKFPQVKCYPLALSAKSGRADMYVSKGISDGSSSLLAPSEELANYPGLSFREKIEVETITLADWAAREGVKHADFLWLDLQGAELDVLKASEEFIHGTSVIYTEVSGKEEYKGGALYPELKRWLESKGFRAVREELPPEWEGNGNVLFVRE